jgi:hypothetical protein
MPDDYHSTESTLVQAPAGGSDRLDEEVSALETAPQAAPRLNLFKVQFQELYDRHLCRHSQFGINVNHLVSVVGSYLGVFGVLAWVAGSPWPLLPIPVAFLVLLAFNVPLRVFVASTLFVALFFTLFLWLPPMPIWLSLALIVLCHYLQNWGHRIWKRELDMTTFNKKYKKGLALFVLLSVYELPILLNYLLFGKRDWIR